MNDIENRPLAESVAAAAETSPVRNLLPALALTVAIAVALFSGYQWYQNRGAGEALRTELARRLVEMDSQNKEAVARAAQAAAALREAEVTLGVLEAKLAEWQRQQMALETLYQELSSSG